MKITLTPFGNLDNGEVASLFTLENDHGTRLKLSNYGGTMTELWTKGRSGEISDILLGYKTWEEWLENVEPYFGCIIGRNCNRIGNARFTIDGIDYQVSANRGTFQLHGGYEGFNKKLWKAQPVQMADNVAVVMEYLSVDGEEGFPGNLSVKTIYSLNNSNELSVEFYAMTDKPTPVNLTNHAYWNLAGEGSGPVYDHELLLLSDDITETDGNSIPTGRLKPVAVTAYDFTAPHRIGERISELATGYDDNYCLRNYSGQLELAAKIFDPGSGRLMEVFTTQPGMQLYTANWFDGSITGKGGTNYLKHGAFCTETQYWPDAMNHINFPGVILRPGQIYKSKTIWRFSIRDSILY